jgi:uncharacterized protein (TIGR02147 family)
MPYVFEYTDYRKYLADWYNEKKKANSSFSYNAFAQKAGFKNKGFFHTVIYDKRNLSKPSVVKICQAIGLTKSEADYFENLVFFNQAVDLKERNYFYEKMNAVRSPQKAVSKTKQVRSDQYEFYSKWYHSAVRSIIDMYDFKGDFKWLAKMVMPPLSVKQAKQSVRLLEKLEMIAKHNNSTYKVTNKSITTGKEVVGLAVQNFHMECAELAKKAIQELPKSRRNITGLTLGISQKSYEQISGEIQEFQEKIMAIANKDEEADRVYQFNFHLFPISKTDDERKKKS